MTKNELKEKILQYLHENRPIRKYKSREIYENILLATSVWNSKSKIKERIFALLHDIEVPPVCSCGKGLKFLGPKHGYRQYCSSKCAMNSPLVQQHQTQSFIKKYGVNRPAQSTSIQEKMWNTTKINLGVKHSQQSESIKNKTKQTNLKKYGADAFTATETFKNKITETYHNKYNGRYPKQDHFSAETWDILNDPTKLQQLNQQYNIVQIADLLQVSVTIVWRWFKKYQIPLISHFNNSMPEQQIKEFITTSLGIEGVFNTRGIIPPKELDIFIPTKNIAIEFCGLYWHSDIHDRIDRDYHLNKMISCSNKGIKLLTFFEDEWNEKRDIVKSIITHQLGLTQNVHQARLCTLVHINKKQKKDFFNKYHIQGDGRGSITYGLEHNGILVACMTFINHGGGTYELNRYATTGSVIGGFSKLLTYFKIQNIWKKIVTYADKRFSSGDVYKKHGFALASESKPGFFYVRGVKRYHRKHFMKHLLKKRLENYNDDLSAQQNLDLMNIHRIWDCGQLRFELHNR